MKKIVLLGILIFIVSVGIGYMYSSYFIEKGELGGEILETEQIEEYSGTNVELKTIEAVSEDKKVTPNTEFAIKKYYDECGHFEFEYEDLPKELINLNKQEIDDYYNDEFEVEEFNNNTLILSKEINGFCNEHFVLKLNDENIDVYKLNTDGSYSLYKATEISKEYLPAHDIQKLEEGLYVYGEGKINASLEDFE